MDRCIDGTNTKFILLEQWLQNINRLRNKEWEGLWFWELLGTEKGRGGGGGGGGGHWGKWGLEWLYQFSFNNSLSLHQELLPYLISTQPYQIL